MPDDEYTVVSVWDWTPSHHRYWRDKGIEEEFRELYGTSSGPGETWTLIGEDGVVAQYPTDLDDAGEDVDQCA